MQGITDFLNQLLMVGPDGVSLTQGLFAVLIAYLGGIFSSLTPCVYPMIPITVGVVGGLTHKGERPSWREIFMRAVSYIAGMTVIYSMLGVAAGLTGKIFGTFTNTSTWYLGLGIVITLAALVMMDVVPFDPAVWMDQIKRKFMGGKSSGHSHKRNNEMTWAGAFVLGASSGFIAAPCTTPVLTTILAYIAKTQSIGLGFSLMVAFSLGLGTLLVIIAAFAGALQVLPRSGKWMKSIKLVSGLILLAFAQYLIYRAGTLGGP